LRKSSGLSFARQDTGSAGPVNSYSQTNML
jgi:hypothetical protein